MDALEAFAQGARCGHIEGKDRCSVYIVGEEYLLSEVALNAQEDLVPPRVRPNWESGYMFGYRLGAEGESLPDDLK